MKKQLLVIAALLCGAALLQAGENLALNGDFAALQDKKAENWANVGKIAIDFQSQGGVRPNLGMVTLSATPESDKAQRTGSIRQKLDSAALVGKKLRLTAWFKGTNFSANDYGMLIINKNWKGSVGVRRFKLDEGAWGKCTKEVVVPQGWTDIQLVVFAVDAQGALSVSGITVEEAAQQ